MSILSKTQHDTAMDGNKGVGQLRLTDRHLRDLLIKLISYGKCQSAQTSTRTAHQERGSRTSRSRTPHSCCFPKVIIVNIVEYC